MEDEAREIDIGHPFRVRARDGGLGWVLTTGVCASPACPASTLHLAVAAVVGEDRAELHPGAPRVAYDVASRELRTEGDGALPASVAAWIAENHDMLDVRFHRHRDQRLPRLAYRSRPPPAWRSSERILHSDIFPADFDPVLVVDGEGWVIEDGWCPDPACPCREVCLGFHGPDGVEEAEGPLGGAATWASSARAKALFGHVARDRGVLERLRARRAEVREAGRWIVAQVYEAERRSRRRAPVVPAPDHIARLREAATKLAAARPWVELKEFMEVRARVMGALTAEGLVSVGDDDDELPACLLFEPASLDAPLLRLAFPTRGRAPLDVVRARLEHDLPLVDGDRVLDVAALPRKAGARDASSAEVELLAVLATAVADAREQLVELADRMLLEGEMVPVTTLRARVEASGGSVDVELVVGEPDLGWTPLPEEKLIAARHEMADEEHGHGDPPSDEPDLDAAMEAFADRARDLGADEDTIAAAVSVAGLLANHPACLVERNPWGTLLPRFVERAPADAIRRGDSDVDRSLRGVSLLATWLGEVGHFQSEEAARLIADVERVRGRTIPTTRRERWKRAEGEPLPAPTAPCPCGSGRRFKKCCMPR